jgi:hypothetical protein
MKKDRPQKATKGHKSRRLRLVRRDGRGRGLHVKLNAQAALDQQCAEFEKRRRQEIARAALELDATDGAILRLVVSHPSLSQQQIGEIVGLGREAVNARINAPKFKRAIQEANRSSLEVFHKNQVHAARVLGRLLDSKDERVQLRAAIVHMWPHIHARDGGGSADLTSLIQEAFDLAQAEKRKPGPESPTGDTDGSC